MFWLSILVLTIVLAISKPLPFFKASYWAIRVLTWLSSSKGLRTATGLPFLVWITTFIPQKPRLAKALVLTKLPLLRITSPISFSNKGYNVQHFHPYL